jgi:hypothetical protein
MAKMKTNRKDPAPTKKKNSSSSVDVALDVASFVPGPVGMSASAIGAAKNIYEGDYKGAALDAANIATGGAAKYLKAASKVAKAAGAPKVAKAAAGASKILNKASNPNIYKSSGFARDVNSLSTNGYSSNRTPQRESTYVAPKPPIQKKKKR